MTDVLTSAPAAAWYPDPAQPELLRWWDGSSWSVHTMARPEVALAIEEPLSAAAPTAPALDSLPPVLHAVPAKQIPEPMPFASGVSLGVGGPDLYNTEPPVLSPIERAARAEIYAKLASSHAVETAPDGNALSADPFGGLARSSGVTWNSPSVPSTLEYDVPLRSSTLGTWLLALSPWLGVGAVAFQTSQLLSGAATTQTLIIVVYAIAGILPFVFAGVDRAGLGGHGHTRRPSWWWMLLGQLAYFIARTVALSNRSRLAFIPLLVWGANVLLASVALLLLLPTFV